MNIILSFKILLVDWRLPLPKKYVFSSREVHNLGTVSRFSDNFDVFDADVWTLQKAFKAYPDEYPGTQVNL